MNEERDSGKFAEVETHVHIADEVVAIIAGIAASQVEGVAGMAGGLVGDITQMLGKKSLSKGVKVSVDGTNVTIDLFVVVNYGVRIPEVAQKVQEAVKRAVEGLTGLRTTAINIHVQGVAFHRGHKEPTRGSEKG